MSAPACPGETLIHGYQVRQHLRRGTEYDVYSVWSIERDCLCIAKMLCPDRAGDTASRARLVAEGRALVAFTHPHLVRGYAVLAPEAPTGPVVLMETLTGATLSRLIEDSAPHGLAASDVAQLGRQLCSALHYLHRHERIHLDLKPSNIVCSNGKAILFDIGLAQSPGSSRRGAGTAEYMAPEQWAGTPIDYATDIWGLGGVLYRALTSHRPFSRSLTDRKYGDTPDLTRLDRQTIDAASRQLVRDCLCVNPAERPGLDSVRQRLETVLASAN